MKKLKFKKIKRLLPVMLLAFIGFNANAQKLPNVQQESVWAPDNIKIDGKATEWDGKFRAYNSANYVYYTLSNDDKNLYFIVFANDNLVMHKIIHGGITLSIINPQNKKNKIAVGFPLQNFKKNNSIDLMIHIKSDVLYDPATSKGKSDSVMRSINEKSSDLFKEIQIKGVDGPVDTVSFYNTLGIKAAFLFNFVNHKVGYTYELAIPLKSLPVSGGHFKYDIILNGRLILQNANGRYNSSESPPTGWLDVPSDFKGEYTLAKK